MNLPQIARIVLIALIYPLLTIAPVVVPPRDIKIPNRPHLQLSVPVFMHECTKSVGVGIGTQFIQQEEVDETHKINIPGVGTV